MAFDIVTFSASLKNLVHKNNTTTSSYNVSSSLKQQVKWVKVGYHKDKPMTVVDYPCVWVEPRRKNDAFIEIGSTARRTMNLTFDIVAITQEGMGLTNGREVADNEMLQLSTNIETLLRNYPKLSVTSQVMQSTISDVEWGVIESNETYNSMARIELNIEIKST